MSHPPILDVTEQTEYTVAALADKYNPAAVRVPKGTLDTRTPVEYHLIEILQLTGQQVFDDPTQWELYQRLIETLRIIDDDFRSEPLDLSPYSIPKPAQGNYNPLGELSELDEPTIKELASRYNAHPPEEIPPEEIISYVQSSLAIALLELGQARLKHKPKAELHCLEALIHVDESHDVQTTLEIETEEWEPSAPDADPEVIARSILATVSGN